MFARLSLESDLVAGSAAGSATILSAAGSVSTLGSVWVALAGWEVMVNGVARLLRSGGEDKYGLTARGLVDKRFEVSELVGWVAPGRHVGEGGGPSSGWWNVGTGVAPGTSGWWLRQSMVGSWCSLRCTGVLVDSTRRQGSTGQVK